MSTRLLDNIRNQPVALRATLAHQLSHVETLSRAVALLKSGRRVLLSGMGASFFACIPFSYRMHALAFESSDLLYFRDTEIDSDTILVLVSRSGESIEVTRLMQVARGRGATVLGVTNVAESSLGRDADLAILVGSPPDEMVAIQTYTSTVATFALLAAEAAGELNAAATELEETATILASLIPECVAARTNWDRLLEGERPVYLLGRGMASGSVLEGVLLMHETAKSPTVGMSVAQFRHGPVEAVDKKFRAIVIGTQPATTHLDAALVNDVDRMGGYARWVGPDNLAALCSWPNHVPARLTPVVEIVPLQLVAYRKAELAGVSPGTFRWAPLVTATEAGFPD